jgi:hypothetical protein
VRETFISTLASVDPAIRAASGSGGGHGPPPPAERLFRDRLHRVDRRPRERRATALIDSISEGSLVDRGYDILDNVYRLRGNVGARYALDQYLNGHGHDPGGRAR